MFSLRRFCLDDCLIILACLHAMIFISIPCSCDGFAPRTGLTSSSSSSSSQLHRSHENLIPVTKPDDLTRCQASVAAVPPASADATPSSYDAEKSTSGGKNGDTDAFSILAELATGALMRSDMRRDAKGKEVGGAGAQGPSSATNWIDDSAAFALKQALNKLSIKLPDQLKGLERDEASSWLRWMKASPTPLIIDLSTDLQQVANISISDDNLILLGTPRRDFLERLGAKLILLPSGAELKAGLVEPTGAFVYGKLLYGGVTRYRLLPSSSSVARPPRRTGENSATMSSVKDNMPSWVMYGGPTRMYEALDMGAAAVLEVTLLPIGKTNPNIFGREGDMALGRLCWSPKDMFKMSEKQGDGSAGEEDAVGGSTPISLSGKERNEAFASDFTLTVGGLSSQIDAIVRRVLDGRVLRPADEDDNVGDEGDSTSAQLSLASIEAEELALLGLTPVRGLLLYGPPGCGKTALAREISRALRARSPKIVSAPELLDRWVGGSEALVRSLFADAEAELAACNGDASRSALHVIVIDEIDAVFRKRTSAEDSGEATRSSVVNQILAKLDGVKAIPNILLIGMTNRRELLDDALLRPGRLEVQIEIPLPSKEGRREILQIHFDALRRRGRLSQPLCQAIDGVSSFDGDVPAAQADAEVYSNSDDVIADGDLLTERKGRKRRVLKKAMYKVIDKVPVVGRPVYDLAADYATGGFSGADIAGLVRCAGSIALTRARRDGNGVEGLLITLEDVKQALQEVKG